MYWEEIVDLKEEILSIFQDLHRHPEIGYDEHRTAGVIAKYLREQCEGISVVEGVALTGVVGVLDSGKPGKTLMLRADMDCLEIRELAQTDCESQNPGKMHACGHDAHVAMLLGAARVLSRHREAFRGKIKFVFQPAEEGIRPAMAEKVRAAGYEGEGGAGFMIQQGVLDDVDACLVMHVQPSLPVGTVSIAKRQACASSDSFRIVVNGRGGHGAQPQEAVDPVPALAELISAIHMLPTREVAAVETCVLSLGVVETPGSVWNAVAERACLEGGIRTFNSKVRGHLNQRVKELAENIAKANRCTLEYHRVGGYAPCINDERLAAVVAKSCEGAESLDKVILTDIPVMTSEDAGAYLERVPGVIFWLGAGTSSDAPPLHSPYFHLDSRALLCGVESHVCNALSVMTVLESGDF